MRLSRLGPTTSPGFGPLAWVRYSDVTSGIVAGAPARLKNEHRMKLKLNFYHIEHISIQNIWNLKIKFLYNDIKRKYKKQVYGILYPTIKSLKKIL